MIDFSGVLWDRIAFIHIDCIALAAFVFSRLYVSR